MRVARLAKVKESGKIVKVYKEGSSLVWFSLNGDLTTNIYSEDALDFLNILNVDNPILCHSKIPDVEEFPVVESFWCINERFASWLFKHPRILALWKFVFSRNK